MKTSLNKMIVACFLMLVSFTKLAALEIKDARCAFDEIPRANIQDSTGRLKWAVKCDPFFADAMGVDMDNPSAWLVRMIYVGGKPENGYKDPIRFPVYSDPISGKVWVAPKSADDSCEKPREYSLISICEDGCVALGTRLLTNRGWTPAGTFDMSLDKSVRSLTANSTFDEPRYADVPVKRFLEDVGIGWQRLLRLSVEGKTLDVTANHPWVRSDGVLVETNSLKVGDALLNADLTPATITAIEPVNVWGKVYNVEPAGSPASVAGTFVLFEGLVSGTLYHQNEGLALMNRRLLRATIPANQLR